MSEDTRGILQHSLHTCFVYFRLGDRKLVVREGALGVAHRVFGDLTAAAARADVDGKKVVETVVE